MINTGSPDWWKVSLPLLTTLFFPLLCICASYNPLKTISHHPYYSIYCPCMLIFLLLTPSFLPLSYFLSLYSPPHFTPSFSFYFSSSFIKGSCRGKVGYFPASYVQAVSPGNQIYQSQFDFAAEGPGELPLLEGQVRERMSE